MRELTKFEALKGVTGIKEYSQLIFELAEQAGSPERLQKELSTELPADSIRTLTQIAE